MVLDHGRIIEKGTHDSLIEKKGVYYRRGLELQEDVRNRKTKWGG